MVLHIMPYKITANGLSDIGLVRPNNEDFWRQLPEDHFFVLADGMGGHQSGEIAARQAVDHLCDIFKHKYASSNKSVEKAKQIIHHGIQEVNQLIYHMSFLRDDLRGMGTTLCCVFFHPDALVYGHVGDSRIYRLRQNKLEQLTHDHSLVRELIDMGQLSEEQAGDFLYKNIITKAIGTEPEIEPTVKAEPIQMGDTILMCTDGLTDLLSMQEIENIINRSDDTNAAKNLVAAAKRKGGFDNVTAVVVNIQEKNEAPDLS